MTVDLPGRTDTVQPLVDVVLPAPVQREPVTADGFAQRFVGSQLRFNPRVHPHWPGLDGLRALAVTAVVIFHFTGSVLPGGFLGVDIFFGISGYLITRLLIREWLCGGWIDLRRFYQRRARRLLPALAVVIGAVCVAALIWRDQLATLRPAVLAAALFGSNWWLALAHQPYFVSTGRPTMLQHLWSLGVEEQFYLLWPVLVVVALTVRGRAAVRRGRDRVVAVRGVVGLALFLAAGSTALTWWLANREGLPYGGSGTFLYYGTDTHCMGLFLGAALGGWAVLRQQAMALSEDVPPDGWDLMIAGLRNAIGVVALAGLIWLVATVDEFWYWLYRGGFLVVGALVCLAIAAATPRGSLLGRVLDWAPLRWLGVRSYSIYLWHWPVAVVTRPGLDNSLPTALDQVVRVAATLLLSDLTYRLVETPARRAGLRRSLTRLAAHLRPRLPERTGGASFGAVVLTGLAVAAVAIVAVGPAAPRSAAAAGTPAGGRHLQLGGTTRVAEYAAGRRAQSTTPAHQAAAKKPTKHDARGKATGGKHPSPPAQPRTPLPRITGFGDSVLLDARAELGRLFAGGHIDAIVGRQPNAILNDAIQAGRAGHIAPVVVLHAGNNGIIDPAQLNRALAALASAKVVLVLTLHLDQNADPWRDPNNAAIRRVVPRYSNAHVVDWDKVVDDHRGWLYPDGIHLSPDGALGYARMLAAAARQYLS